MLIGASRRIARPGARPSTSCVRTRRGRRARRRRTRCWADARRANASGSALSGRSSPCGPLHLVLVERAAPEPGEEQLPDAAFDALAHRVAAAVPAVEVADDRDPRRVRRPDHEAVAMDALHGHRVGAQLLVELEVACPRPSGRRRARPAPAGSGRGRRARPCPRRPHAQAIGKARAAAGNGRTKRPSACAREIGERSAARRVEHARPRARPGWKVRTTRPVGAPVHAEHGERVAVVAAATSASIARRIDGAGVRRS